jgi:hypothetical protein
MALSRSTRGARGHRLAAALVFLLLAACGTRLPPVTLVYSAAEMEARLAERFPLARKHHVLYELTVSNPRVALDVPRKRVALSLDALLSFPLGGRPIQGSARISGVPRYDSATRGIYLADAEVEAIDIERVPQPLRQPLAVAMSGLARDLLDRRPVFVIPAERLQRGAVTLTPRLFEVVAEGLRVEIGLATP